MQVSNVYISLYHNNNEKQHKMKATQLTQQEVNKIVRALELAYGDESTLDKSALKLARKLSKAKAVKTAK
mgnify:CR=1 FL=1